jgi:hypothetical protein
VHTAHVMGMDADLEGPPAGIRSSCHQVTKQRKVSVRDVDVEARSWGNSIFV